MKRILAGALFASCLGLTFSACDDQAYWVGYGGSGSSNCSSYLSCDTCTPAYGCGWCTAPNGSGVCASDPDYCPTQEFTWTWNTAGCRAAADASVVPDDGATDVGITPVEASTNDGPADVLVETSTDAASGSDAPMGDAKAD